MNLKQLYGKRYRVTLDESWEHEKEEGKALTNGDITKLRVNSVLYIRIPKIN